MGTPAAVTAAAEAVASVVPGVPLRGHFHDTYGRGVVNALAAVRPGIRVLDASAGGVGGCPFAAGAAGNTATEDLAAALRDSGAATSIDIDLVTATGGWLRELLASPPDGTEGQETADVPNLVAVAQLGRVGRAVPGLHDQARRGSA